MIGEPLIVLLVEDNPAHAEMVIRSFQEHRVANKIYHVLDGEAALDFLYHRGPFSMPDVSPRPHIILLDLRLPKIGGLQVLQEIKKDEDLLSIPVIILTTSEAERDLTMAYENHTNSYLVKPIDFAKFSQLINDLGLYWLAWNRQPW
ncbi:MAG TPA: response regulator [Anaerolineae bacterium]|nr:response regulator [Anaerolineae bacterium]HQI84549.1 response regulator [Anaerolineae bacterium]